jgi:hypothetical protein
MDWIGSARTNYFRVKDAAAFVAAMEPFDVCVLKREEDPLFFGLAATTDGGDWPSFDEEDEDLDFVETVRVHLQDGEVAVFMTVGAEGMRYLTGYAIAVNSVGERVDVDIDDIYEAAKLKFGVSNISDITRAEY